MLSVERVHVIRAVRVAVHVQLRLGVAGQVEVDGRAVDPVRGRRVGQAGREVEVGDGPVHGVQ